MSSLLKRRLYSSSSLITEVFYLSDVGSGGSGGGTPAEPPYSLQFNNNGVFGGSANLLYVAPDNALRANIAVATFGTASTAYDAQALAVFYQNDTSKNLLLGFINSNNQQASKLLTVSPIGWLGLSSLSDLTWQPQTPIHLVHNFPRITSEYKTDNDTGKAIQLIAGLNGTALGYTEPGWLAIGGISNYTDAVSGNTIFWDYGNKVGIGYQAGTSVPTTPAQVSIKSSDTTSGAHIFGIESDNSIPMFFVLNRSAFVGVGTDSPAVNFHVVAQGQSWAGGLFESADYSSIRLKTSHGDYMFTSNINEHLDLFEWTTGRYIFTISKDLQFKIGDYSSTLHNSVVFDVATTIATAGVHRGSRPAPSMQTADRDSIPSPVCGLLIFNTDNHSYEYWNCDSNAWTSILPVMQPTPQDKEVLYMQGNTVTGKSNFTFDYTNNITAIPRLLVNSSTMPGNGSSYIYGNGTDALGFFNDLGVSSDGHKIIAYFSRFFPNPGNAGFYSGYKVESGAVAYNWIYAPGGNDFGISVYNGGQGMDNPAVYIKDSSNYVGIGTKNPDTQLHVYTEAAAITEFVTNQSYGNIQVLAPNLGDTHRIGVLTGITANALDAFYTYAYYPSISGESAAEIGTGSPAAISSVVPRLRIAQTSIQLQTPTTYLTRHATLTNSWTVLAWLHGNKIADNNIVEKAAIASRSVNSSYNSDFSIAVNIDTSNTAVHPTNDSRIWIDGLDGYIGMWNTQPQTTLDITGAYRAISKEPLPYAKNAKFYYVKYDAEFIQRGKISIPRLLGEAYSNIPTLADIPIFVDFDFWTTNFSNVPDFGLNQNAWNRDGYTVLTPRARYGWGNMLRFSTTHAKTRIYKKLTLEKEGYYMITMVLVHYPNTGSTGDYGVMFFDTANGESFGIIYTNYRLYMENAATGNRSSAIAYFSSGSRVVVSILLNKDNTRLDSYATRNSAGTIYHRTLTCNVAGDGDATFYVGAWPTTYTKDPNVYVQHVAVTHWKKLPPETEIWRTAKRLANLLG